MIPCVFVLIKNKTEDLYTKVLRKIKHEADILKIDLNPKSGLSDFELSIINSFNTLFPKAIVKGYFFHYTQCIFKQVVQLGLKKHTQRIMSSVNGYIK